MVRRAGSLLDRLLDEAVAGDQTVPLRAVYLGGTMLDRRIVERIEDDFGIIVMRAYGSSEVPVSTSGLRNESSEVRHADDGVALADVEVRLGSAGDPAECCIRGPHAFLGYTDADDDAQAFDGEWFRTGDVADIADGRVRIVGRIKDIVIRNGLNIPAAEVEEAVARIAGVRECAAYAVADAATGERLAVAMVLDADVDLSLATRRRGAPRRRLTEIQAARRIGVLGSAVACERQRQGRAQHTAGAVGGPPGGGRRADRSRLTASLQASAGRKTGTTKPSSSSRNPNTSSMSARRSSTEQPSTTVMSLGPSSRSTIATT